MKEQDLKSLGVFRFVDYDSEDTTAIYIATDINACYNIAEELEHLRNCELEEAEDEFPELVEELGKRSFKKLVEMVEDEYFEAFDYLCKKRGLLIAEVSEDVYRY